MAAVVPIRFEPFGDGGVVGEDEIGLTHGFAAEFFEAMDGDFFQGALDGIGFLARVELEAREGIGAVEDPDAFATELARDGPGDLAEGDGVSAVAGLDDVGVADGLCHRGGYFAFGFQVLLERDVERQRGVGEAVFFWRDFDGVEAAAGGEIELVDERRGDGKAHAGVVDGAGLGAEVFEPHVADDEAIGRAAAAEGNVVEEEIGH